MVVGVVADVTALGVLEREGGSEQVAHGGLAGIGGGYGYNLVLPHQWLVHLSSLPTFIIFSRVHRRDGSFCVLSVHT